MLNLSKINLSRLIGSRYFILLYIVLKNGYKITFIALANSGVNSLFLLICLVQSI
jgi:hypothetical protein